MNTELEAEAAVKRLRNYNRWHPSTTKHILDIYVNKNAEVTPPKFGVAVTIDANNEPMINEQYPGLAKIIDNLGVHTLVDTVRIEQIGAPQPAQLAKFADD